MTDRLSKEQALNHWHRLPARMPLKAAPIPYKQKGSTYGQDGIRIEGSREFIDGVLARLKDLMAFEAAETRLNVNYQRVQPREGKPCNGDWVCYVKVHERGREGKILASYMGVGA